MTKMSSWRSLGIAIALAFSMSGSLSAATIIADLRADYDASVGGLEHDPGTSVEITDSIGTGSWNYFGSESLVPGTLKPMFYTTLPNGKNGFEAVSETQSGSAGKVNNSGVGTEVVPSGNLAVSPGTAYRGSYLTLRWTAGSEFVGPLTITTSLVSPLYIAGNALEMYLWRDGERIQLGETLKTTSTSSRNSGDIFFTMGLGDYIDVVITNVNAFLPDIARVSVQITGTVVPEPGTMTLAGMGILGVAGQRIRRRRRQSRSVA